MKPPAEKLDTLEYFPVTYPTLRAAGQAGSCQQSFVDLETEHPPPQTFQESSSYSMLRRGLHPLGHEG